MGFSREQPPVECLLPAAWVSLWPLELTTRTASETTNETCSAESKCRTLGNTNGSFESSRGRSYIAVDNWNDTCFSERKWSPGESNTSCYGVELEGRRTNPILVSGLDY